MHTKLGYLLYIKSKTTHQAKETELISIPAINYSIFWNFTTLQYRFDLLCSKSNLYWNVAKFQNIDTAQKIKFSIKDFFSKCDQIPTIFCGFGHIYWINPKWKTSFFLCSMNQVKSTISDQKISWFFKSSFFQNILFFCRILTSNMVLFTGVSFKQKFSRTTLIKKTFKNLH